MRLRVMSILSESETSAVSPDLMYLFTASRMSTWRNSKRMSAFSALSLSCSFSSSVLLPPFSITLAVMKTRSISRFLHSPT